MTRTYKLIILFFGIIPASFLKATGLPHIVYNVKDFGATGKGMVYDTKAIQSAIDSAAAQGGGTIYFPDGSYLTKTLALKDHIRLYLDQGAILLGSTEMKEFKPEYGSFTDSGGRKFGTSLIFAKNVEDIGIAGNGTIDGQGYAKYYPAGQGTPRPSLIRLVNCKNVKVRDVTMVNSAAWVQHYIRCKNLRISGITVDSYSNKNNDGLDIESCERVFVTGCNISSEDDAIVLKALTPNPCRDVVISDCIVSGLKSAIKTGTESVGNFENITITNCTINGTRGISLLTVDGGSINNVTISNISMQNAYAVIVMRLGERMRPYAVPPDKRPESTGTFRNIMVSNIQAVNITKSNNFITGIPDHDIENVTISNMHIEYAGGGKAEDSGVEVPEKIKDYPKASMFDILPSYGLFIRHARNILLTNISLEYINKDGRSVIKFIDVKNSEINGLKARSEATSAPFIWLKNSDGIKISDATPVEQTKTFLKAEDCGKVILTNNALSKALHKYELINTRIAIEKNNY